MRKIIIIAGSMLCALLAACADSPEKSASRDYVNAARKVLKAAKAFDAADYKGAYKLCTEARSDVEQIVEKYPETPVALKVVTDSSTLIGPCRYVDLTERIIPKLSLFGNPDMEGVEFAWVVAISQADPDRRDSALFGLAEAVSGGEFLPKIKTGAAGKIVSAAVSNIRSPELRGVAGAKFASGVLKGRPRAENAEKPVLKVSLSVQNTPKIGDIEAFLKAAKTDASLVAYNIASVDELRKKALAVRGADGSARGQFEKILSDAYDNILKISAASIREKALCGIAVAFANFGDNLRAIAITYKIENAEMFNSVFYEIAEKIGRDKNNYRQAVVLSDRLKNRGEKDKFLSELASNVAERGMYAESREISSKIKDAGWKNAALARGAKHAFDSSNDKEAVAFISSMDISNLDCLSIFDGAGDADKFGRELLQGARLAKLSFKIASADAKTAEALNRLAVSELSRGGAENAKGFAYLCGIVARNMVSLGKPGAAFSFISERIRNRGHFKVLFGDICAIGMNAAANSDAELARKAFRLAADVCGSCGPRECVYLALAVQLSGLSAEDCAEILSPFLPKFGI